MKKVTKREYELQFKPWITKEILQQCKDRVMLLKSIGNENDPLRKTIYMLHMRILEMFVLVASVIARLL